MFTSLACFPGGWVHRAPRTVLQKQKSLPGSFISSCHMGYGLSLGSLMHLVWTPIMDLMHGSRKILTFSKH